MTMENEVALITDDPNIKSKECSLYSDQSLGIVNINYTPEEDNNNFEKTNLMLQVYLGSLLGAIKFSAILILALQFLVQTFLQS